MDIKKKLSLARKWKHYFEGLIYIECLSHSRKKVPSLEISGDATAFYNSKDNLIHIGVGITNAETEEELFSQIHYFLGHELQHMLSSTDKDWMAAHKLCFRNACQRLSVRVFGRTRTLTKDSDYDAFFKELAANGVFVSHRMVMYYVNFVLNSLEDGRIENIRPRLHPGFGNYKKIFRGKMWLNDDFCKEKFFEADPEDLDALGQLKALTGQLYYLSTLGLYQKGFLEAYSGSKLHKKVQSFIPDISGAVLGKTCKTCMEHGTNIFNRLIDEIIDVCTIQASAEELEAFLKQLLEKLMEEAANQSLSATPNTEEQGDGLPAESPFGHSELELELTKEELKELLEDADADEEDLDGPMSVNIKVKEETEAEDGEKSDDSSDSPSGKDEKEDGSQDEANASDSSKSDMPADGKSGQDGQSKDSDGTKDSDGSKGADGKDGDQDTGEESSDSSNESGQSSSSASTDSSDETASSENSSGTIEKNTSKGFNNRLEGERSASERVEKDLEAMVAEQMKAAAENAETDFGLAEADAKLDEEFKKAAEQLKAVEPGEVDLAPVNEKYSYDVKFVESTRVYDPTERLPLELENSGRSLNSKIEELVKNKQDPDQRFLKSGMLDTRRLTSLAMGDINVFKKKGQPNKTDVAAFLLMDNSGSMGNGPGSTRFACCNAFAVLEEGFKKHMPLKIAAFDAWSDYEVTHEVIKEFDEVVGPNLSYNFRNLGRGGNGNKDGYSIRVATRQLMERPEKDKILIIASDGFPTEYSSSRVGCADVKAAVAEARKAGIRTIGMYMYHYQNDTDFATYSDMYGPEIIFSSLDEIEDDLTRILKRYF